MCKCCILFESFTQIFHSIITNLISTIILIDKKKTQFGFWCKIGFVISFGKIEKKGKSTFRLIDFWKECWLVDILMCEIVQENEKLEEEKEEMVVSVRWPRDKWSCVVWMIKKFNINIQQSLEPLSRSTTYFYISSCQTTLTSNNTQNTQPKHNSKQSIKLTNTNINTNKTPLIQKKPISS